MPGFVDVTGWTSEQVRRLGHADDYDDVDHRPRQRFNKTRQAEPVSVQYPASDVWAAACAAQRVNGGYHKEDQREWDEAKNQMVLIRRRNRDIMMEFLRNPERMTAEDLEAGDQCRQFLKNDLTFRALKGRLTDFDLSVQKALAPEDHFDEKKHRYELAIIACLPAGVARSQQRQTVDERMSFARGGLIGQPGNKITANVEVLSANYSQQYNIFWIRGITDQDQPVMFSNREKFDVGTHLTVQGKVKAHRDNLTQLNYVKVL